MIIRLWKPLLLTTALSLLGTSWSPADDPEEVRVEQTRFAPGTVTVIPPAPQPDETFTGPISLRDLIEAHPEIEWSAPDFPDGKPFFDARTRTLREMAQQVILRREVYCFEFAFKPLRQMYIDIPQSNGSLQRKLIWYMVYRVRYAGGDLRPSTAADSTKAVDRLYSRVEKVSYETRRFFPMVVLVDHETKAQYVDRILPAALDRIQVREKITAKLHNSVEMTQIPIPRSADPSADGVWGVLTWEDVEPQTDFLSLYVYGLSNAFQRVTSEENPSAKPVLIRKALQLNFYRPGDSIGETDDRIRFGIPAFESEEEQAYVLKQYGLEKRLDYQWVYR